MTIGLEEKTLSITDELIELKPYAITLGTGGIRPVLILKDADKKISLPIWMHPFEAGVSLAQGNPLQPPFTPHNITKKILETFTVAIEKCLFKTVKGHYQYAELIFSNHPTLERMEVRAEDVLSLCLHLKVPFYCTRTFLQESLTLNEEQVDLGEKVKVYPELVGRKSNQYMM